MISTHVSIVGRSWLHLDKQEVQQENCIKKKTKENKGV